MQFRRVCIVSTILISRCAIISYNKVSIVAVSGKLYSETSDKGHSERGQISKAKSTRVTHSIENYL